MAASILTELFESTQQRRRPEDVAQMIVDLMQDELTVAEQRIIGRAANRSAKRMMSWATSMMEDFSRPLGMERQIRVAERIFGIEGTMSAAQCAQPEVLEDFLQLLNEEISKNFGQNDFMFDRLNRQMREIAGLGEMSNRQYNKRFRLISRMELKLRKLLRELKKARFAQIGKSGLTMDINQKDFARNRNTAAFVAYFVARQNLRSEFTISGQQKPFDEIAKMLFDRCLKDSQTAWAVIARVFADARVLEHLSDAEKGELLGMWLKTLKDIAVLLQEIWTSSKIDSQTMIVRRGNDSTTWNNTANAWNQARKHWIALLYAMGLSEVLEVLCPGKVLRLMAADVAAWHRAAGGGLDPNTFVWNALPFPWKVLLGGEVCTLDDVKQACERFNVDARKTGWIETPPAHVVKYRASPELVHGVTVADPVLAKTLRKARCFSGKAVRSVPVEFVVERDEYGAALEAKLKN